MKNFLWAFFILIVSIPIPVNADWDAGDTTEDSALFTFGEVDQVGWNHWIVDNDYNSYLQNKPDGSTFFAYVLGKKDHTSALVRAHTFVKSIGGIDNVIAFQFYVIQGQIDNDGESQIDYMTELTFPSFGNKVAVKTNFDTLPDWQEYEGSDENVPSGSYSVKRGERRTTRNVTRGKWTFEFEVKEVSGDADGSQHIINHPQIPEGYHLVYVKGSDNQTETNNWEAYCLLHSDNSEGLNKARLLVLDDGEIDDDADVYINDLKIVKTLRAENENFDNVLYKEYRDMFLLNARDKRKESSDILAQFLPSHLLYSPEDYTWDSVRLRLIDNGSEVSAPYIKAEYNQEGTIGKMFKDKKSLKMPDAQRTPILFIHGWQGDKSDAFSILHDYDWTLTGNLKDVTSSGEAYWRNLLAYMYRDHYEDFAGFKPYIYHYPSYKHVKFNARMLKELLESIDDDVMRRGIDNGELIIVAHSMGTIVSRSLMEEFGYLSHVKQFISLAGVHHGSPGSVKSLVDTSIAVPKDLYTPGACDLIPDNYDGFIDTSIKKDIQINVGTKELLEQRAACGSVFVIEGDFDGKYNTDRKSFDLHYLEKLGISDESKYYVRRNFEVPFQPNPWLLHLNKKHYKQHREATKDKYYFYTGYVIADGTGDILLGSDPWIPRAFPQWVTDPLRDDLIMDEVAAITVASESNYEYLDSVVPLSYGILDTSRGRLLEKNGMLNHNYDTSKQMPNDLEMDTVPEISSSKLYFSSDDFLFTGKNSWGAPFRIFGDYNHDRMFNGGYQDVDNYRTGSGTTGSAHRKFDEYLKSVTGEETAPNTDHFKNDPLFVQIRADILYNDTTAYWTGNGSIISYHGKNANEDNYDYPYGLTLDAIGLHPKLNVRPVGFFQWQVSKGSCERLKIDTDVLPVSEKNVDITFGVWSSRDLDLTFENVTLPFVLGEDNTGYTFSDDDSQWYIVGVAFKNPISKSAWLNAICTSESPTSSSYTTNKVIILGNEYKWNGNASIISGMFTPLANEEERFGVFKDVTQVHPSSEKPVVFFQWMSSDVCKRLTIDTPELSDSEKKAQQVQLGIKIWNSDSYQPTSVTLPYTLNSKGTWNVIKVAFDNPVNQSVLVEASCPGNSTTD